MFGLSPQKPGCPSIYYSLLRWRQFGVSTSTLTLCPFLANPNSLILAVSVFWVLLVGGCLLGLLVQGSRWDILETTTVPEAISKAVTLCEFEGQKLFTWQIRVCPELPSSSQSLFWTDGRLTQYLGPWQRTQEIEAEVTKATKTFCFLMLNGDSILPSLMGQEGQNLTVRCSEDELLVVQIPFSHNPSV